MINYFADDARTTPINLAIARVLIAGLMLWKLIHYEWAPLRGWPTPLRDWLPLFRHPILFGNIEWIVLACGILLVGVLVGYRLRLTAFTSAILLTYLGAVRHSYQVSHTSRILFNAALILLLFAVFADEDKLSVDQLRRTRSMSLERLTDHLEEPRPDHRNRALKWTLIVMGFFYFQAGFAKLLWDPIAWIQPANLNRYVLYGSGGFVGDLMLQFPVLSTVGAVMTIVLEIGFLLAIVARLRIWPFLFGLVGMHVAIMFSVGPVFTDQLVFLAMLLPWDRGVGAIQPKQTLTVVYDRHCFFCARSLHLFRYMDVANTVEYFNQYSVPDEIDGDGVDYEEAMYAYNEGTAYRGYFAFVRLFRHLGLFRPMAVAMVLPGIATIGQAVYRHIAANRSRYFVCAVQEK